MLYFANIPKPKLGLVILHVLLWLAFLFLPFLLYRITILDASFYINKTINNLLLIGLFYLHYYYIFPRFFVKNRIKKYIAIVIGCVLFFTAQQMLVDYYFMYSHFGPGAHRAFIFAGDETRFTGGTPAIIKTGNPLPFFPGMQKPPFIIGNPYFSPVMFWTGPFMRAAPSVVIMFILGGFIRVALRWFESEKQKEALEIEKLNAELDFLKAQVNPHFLFNSLNTIYALAHKQSVQTEVATLKLSQILRYVIYDASLPLVPLAKEISYIESYITLQKYRIDKNFSIKYNSPGITDSLLIEPMLLIPFVENAFKHGLSYRAGSFININIYTVDSMLYFIVINTYAKEETNKNTGIGLTNVKRRLQLSYFDRHNLAITDINGKYSVNLEIQLKHDELPGT